MSIEFEKHIIELLKNNQCVVVPGFGGFLLKSISSSIHQNTILPPSKQIAFNKSLVHDDELLTGAIMGAYGLDYQIAKNKVVNYANQLAYTLRKEQHLTVKQIGSFTVSENNQIIFKPFINNLVDKEAFGLNQLHIKPISKTIIKETPKEKAPIADKVATQKIERKSAKRKKSKIPVVGFVSSFLLIAGIVGLMATDTQLGNNNFQKASFIDSFFPKESHIESFSSIKKDKDNILLSTSQKEGVSKGRVYTLNGKEYIAGYYIVVGAYASIENAKRKEQELFNQGKDSYIIPAENGLNRVCIYANQDYIQAKKMLTSLNKKSYWLMKNESL